MPIQRHVIALFATLGLATFVDMSRGLLVGGVTADSGSPRWLVTFLFLMAAIATAFVGQRDLILIPLARQRAAASLAAGGWLWSVYAWVRGLDHVPLSPGLAYLLWFGLGCLIIVSGWLNRLQSRDHVEEENAAAQQEGAAEPQVSAVALGGDGRRRLLDILGSDRRRAIVQHMTASERREFERLSQAYGVWVACSFALPTAFAWAFVGGIGWPPAAAITALALIVHVWGAIPRRRAMSDFLESTEWARTRR